MPAEDRSRSQRLGKQQRVRRRTEFNRTLRRGTCAADGTLVLFALPTAPERPPRLGVTIPRRAGGAVLRNRWKRLIRESYRTQQQSVPTGYDYIIRPKKDARPEWQAVRRSVPRLAQKAVRRHQQANRRHGQR